MCCKVEYLCKIKENKKLDDNLIDEIANVNIFHVKSDYVGNNIQIMPVFRTTLTIK